MYIYVRTLNLIANELHILTISYILIAIYIQNLIIVLIFFIFIYPNCHCLEIFFSSYCFITNMPWPNTHIPFHNPFISILIHRLIRLKMNDVMWQTLTLWWRGFLFIFSFFLSFSRANQVELCRISNFYTYSKSCNHIFMVFFGHVSYFNNNKKKIYSYFIFCNGNGEQEHICPS